MHFKRVLIASSVVKCRLILSVCALIILAMPFAFKTIIEIQIVNFSHDIFKNVNLASIFDQFSFYESATCYSDKKKQIKEIIRIEKETFEIIVTQWQN